MFAHIPGNAFNPLTQSWVHFQLNAILPTYKQIESTTSLAELINRNILTANMSSILTVTCRFSGGWCSTRCWGGGGGCGCCGCLGNVEIIIWFMKTWCIWAFWISIISIMSDRDNRDNNNYNNYRIYPYKFPGAMHFSKGGATITDKKNSTLDSSGNVR